ncbi:MAG: flavin reductase family protein [Candidatus Marinimicrobia bacterium]|nr:flavin reductase family protein [Candidatus Neomarinimicrobiota bacterium]
MKVDPANLDVKESHKILTSIIIPRPIAWVTTLNEDGSVNAAPFSFFMGVSTKPPRLAISVSAKGGEIKDTSRNIIKNSEFVVNMVTNANVEAMNSTAGLYDYGVEELKIAGLSTSESEKIAPPCIKESPVSMECKLEKVVEIGDKNHFLFIGEVVLFHINDDMFENGAVVSQKIHAVGRLEGSFYSHVSDIFEL